jgi:hypothetical protein
MRFKAKVMIVILARDNGLPAQRRLGQSFTTGRNGKKIAQRALACFFNGL